MYSERPVNLGHFDITLSEVMYYLYLPVRMGDSEIRLPKNVEICRPLIEAAQGYLSTHTRDLGFYEYVYLSARKGWATPDNPLNRPGWHCDGFGTHDINFVWWTGPGTRFAAQEFEGVEMDHVGSLIQFEQQVRRDCIYSPPEKNLYAISPFVVHATPVVGAPGCMRQYIKVSMSNEKYNLENNSHNYLFDYDWPLHSRDIIRNDPHKAQLDFVA